MAKIDAKMVKELRERTGAGMMDCKKALTETDGDMDKAIDYLREKGIAKAEKKAGRIASEGVVAAYVADSSRSTARRISSPSRRSSMSFATRSPSTSQRRILPTWTP